MFGDVEDEVAKEEPDAVESAFVVLVFIEDIKLYAVLEVVDPEILIKKN